MLTYGHLLRWPPNINVFVFFVFAPHCCGAFLLPGRLYRIRSTHKRSHQEKQNIKTIRYELFVYFRVSVRGTS